MSFPYKLKKWYTLLLHLTFAIAMNENRICEKQRFPNEKEGVEHVIGYGWTGQGVL